MPLPRTRGWTSMTLTFITVGAAIGGWLIVARRWLLAWYLREVRRLDLPQAPEDAIITYPLA